MNNKKVFANKKKLPVFHLPSLTCNPPIDTPMTLLFLFTTPAPPPTPNFPVNVAAAQMVPFSSTSSTPPPHKRNVT